MSRPATGVLEEILSASPEATREAWRPTLLRLEPGEHGRFSDLCRRRGIRVVDELERQLGDLAAVHLPGGGPAERKEFVERFVAAAGGIHSSGTWVVLPWERKVVHILDEESYFRVITNRNHEKITPLEQERLRTKKVGVMGLSLGAEAAAVVAQEHLCGHLVLADFDRLDLSNLNRLNAGFDDLGLRKTTIAARRIAKLNPYLEVTVFEEGVTEANAATFLDGLDLLIEECDDLRAKFDIRLMARERGLDIVFAGDERGFLSVEPYGQHPDLPPFHGRITEPPPSRDEFPTPHAFLAELTRWLGGWEWISSRTRDSLEQIGDTLCGYPQLAGEARFAAGQVGHVARRLLLGERLEPFVGQVDLDEIVTGTGR